MGVTAMAYRMKVAEYTVSAAVNWPDILKNNLVSVENWGQIKRRRCMARYHDGAGGRREVAAPGLCPSLSRIILPDWLVHTFRDLSAYPKRPRWVYRSWRLVPRNL